MRSLKNRKNNKVVKTAKKIVYFLSAIPIVIVVAYVTIDILNNNYNSIIEIANSAIMVSSIIIGLEIFSYSDILRKLPKKPTEHQIELLDISFDIIKYFSLTIIFGFLTILFYNVKFFFSIRGLVLFFLFAMILFNLYFAFSSLFELFNYPKKIYPKEFEKLYKED